MAIAGTAAAGSIAIVNAAVFFLGGRHILSLQAGYLICAVISSGPAGAFLAMSAVRKKTTSFSNVSVSD